MHIYFRFNPLEFPSGIISRKFFKIDNKHDCIEIKGNADYVIALPSIHLTGYYYQMLISYDNLFTLSKDNITELLNRIQKTNTCFMC